MRPYSDDLRSRIIEAIDRGEQSWREIASRFVVNLSTVVRLVQRHRRDGTIRPRPHAGGRAPALGPEQLRQLRELVRDRPDATLRELRDSLAAKCSLATLSRTLKAMGLSRKRKVLYAAERETPASKRKRTIFRKKLKGRDPRALVFVDETSVNTAMTRPCAWAPVGERVEGAVPSQWQTVTLICGMRLSGVTAPLVVRGAVDTATFASYAEEVLAPQLRPGDIVVWDNVAPHHARDAVKAVEARSAEVMRLPPMSPDLDPIEEMYSKVKSELRSAAARTTESVIEAIGEALRKISIQDIWGWFNSRAAYAMRT